MVWRACALQLAPPSDMFLFPFTGAAHGTYQSRTIEWRQQRKLLHAVPANGASLQLCEVACTKMTGFFFQF